MWGLLGLQDYGGAQAEEGNKAGDFSLTGHFTIIACWTRVAELVLFYRK